jgi:hypothetical protein
LTQRRRGAESPRRKFFEMLLCADLCISASQRRKEALPYLQIRASQDLDAETPRRGVTAEKIL